MLPVEEVLRMERESEGKRKAAAIKRKKRETRLRLTAFACVAFVVLIFSPPGLQFAADVSKPRMDNAFFGLILQKSTDILWVYGFYEESFEIYRHMYEKTDSAKVEKVKKSFYNMALTQYMLKEYRTALQLYRIYKARWPKDDKETIEAIDRRVTIILGMNPNSLGGYPKPWVEKLMDQYLDL